MSRSRLCFLSFATFILTLSAGSFGAAKPNIILITLGSVRADHVGFLDAKHSTPNLDALAKQSIMFERAYAQAPRTVVSDATILSGTYPQTNGVGELGPPLIAGVPWLPEILHGRGYKAVAFVGSSGLDPKKGFAPGFDRGFDAYESSGETGQILHVVAWLSSKQETPFFLWVNIATSGSGAASAADGVVGKLLDALRAKKLFDDAIVIVTADHGESLGAHGEDTHGIFLYDETIHIPLLLKLLQQQLAGKRVTARVRALDIAPTVLEAAGIPVPSQMQGQSLLRIAKAATNADLPAYSRSDLPQQAFGWSAIESWRTGKYLYIRAPKPELYDLSADPGATHNLSQTSKAILQTLASQLDGFDAHFSRGKNSETQLSSSEMQKLASLGYVGLQKTPSSNTAAQGIDPKDAIAIANQTLSAMFDLQQGKVDKAIAGFQQALIKQPNIYLAQYGLGRALSQKQRYAEAVERLHKAIELQPDSTWANFEIGRALLKTGDFKTAAVHLEIAANRMPEFSEVHALLAETYDRLGRKNDADREAAKADQLSGKR
jgi:choline-sulfatase